MRRHALGILAILLLIVAVYGWITYGMTDSEANLFFSTCERIGLVFGVTWMAYPQLVRVASKTSARFVLLMAGIGLIILVRPKSIFMLGPVMLILAGLQFAGWLMKPAAAGGRRQRREAGQRPEDGRPKAGRLPAERLIHRFEFGGQHRSNLRIGRRTT